MEILVKTGVIGARIRVFRQNAGLSQEKLAELVGVTPQQIQKYEVAKTKISTDRIQMIAIALRVHVSAFFHDRDDELTLNESESTFIKKLRRVKDRRVNESLMLILDRLVRS
jgi:transcriptional regulator with XRE-family HTH domain